MDKAFKYRMYPSEDQQILINKTLGCTRVYIQLLPSQMKELRETQQQSMTYVQCSADLTILKQQLEWLREADKFALQNALKDLNTSYQNFFREIRKGNGSQGYPKFKSKHDNWQSYRTNYTNYNIEIRQDMLKLPKLGRLKFANSRDVEGKIINATITKTPSGKYYVSICCDVGEIPQLPHFSHRLNCVIAADTGIRR